MTKKVKTISNHLFFSWVEDELAAGNEVRFKVKGVSMSPLLRNGKDEVVMVPCQADELKPMDVVLFRYRGGHLLHRIIRREGEQLWIQGDGSFVAVEQCDVKDVVGKLCRVYRPSGRVICVKSKRWRWSSRLWRCSDLLRCLFLRIFLFFSSK